MVNWRRYQDQSYKEENPRRARPRPRCRQSRNSRCGVWQPTVPRWEKQFCLIVGAMPWKKLMEAKKYISIFNDVVEWNDSASEEAFRNAKGRFWAKINGLPCSTSPPDPDIYIDNNIDWNSHIDPELFSGLEVEESDEEDATSDNSSLVLLDQPVQPTGWDIVYSEEMERGKSLTGLIVGDCGGNNENGNSFNVKSFDW
ncbi:hypothetical protein L1049_021692 [Liquidambar formosana]|uniref:Uncharacterized protein n=1 Tax=Liquidambar formosana TaxID=63359 RepID=A0AAP0RCE1_LIQFO